MELIALVEGGRHANKQKKKKKKSSAKLSSTKEKCIGHGTWTHTQKEHVIPFFWGKPRIFFWEAESFHEKVELNYIAWWWEVLQNTREERRPQAEGAMQNRKTSLGVARSLICRVDGIRQENKLETKADHKGDLRGKSYFRVAKAIQYQL